MGAGAGSRRVSGCHPCPRWAPMPSLSVCVGECHVTLNFPVPGPGAAGPGKSASLNNLNMPSFAATSPGAGAVAWTRAGSRAEGDPLQLLPASMHPKYFLACRQPLHCSCWTHCPQQANEGHQVKAAVAKFLPVSRGGQTAAAPTPGQVLPGRAAAGRWVMGRAVGDGESTGSAPRGCRNGSSSAASLASRGWSSRGELWFKGQTPTR